DAASGPAQAIVNQPLVRALWPDGRGLGETLRVLAGGRTIAATVVGITAKTHTRGLDRETPSIYFPLGRERFDGELSLVTRTATPASLVRPLRDAAQAIDPDVSMTSV